MYNVALIQSPEAVRMNRLLALVVAVLVAAPALAQNKPVVKPPTAVITLEKGGQITLEFFPDDAPKHVENFVKLVRAAPGTRSRPSSTTASSTVACSGWRERTIPIRRAASSTSCSVRPAI